MQKADSNKILEAMTLAPSAHNTQPWSFTLEGDTISVYAEWNRHLGTSDPTKRQLYTSIGCAIENGVIAGHALGYSAKVTLFPNGNGGNGAVASMQFAQSAPDLSAKRLYEAISRRRNDRSIYDSKPLTAQERQALQTTANTILIVESRDSISKLADLTSEGTFESLAKKDFKQELSKWVRSSLTRKHDGMTGDAMGLPAPIAVLAPFLIKPMPIHKQEGSNAKKQVESASAVVIFTAPSDSFESFIETGRLLERLWLAATAAGLAVAVHASAIETNDTLREKLKQVLNTTALPQIMVRVGHSTKKGLRALPRRTVEECLKIA